MRQVQHRDSQNGEHGWYHLLGERVKRLVRLWRRFDAKVNKPLPEGRSTFWTLMAPDGYPWYAPALGLLLVITMALGPTIETGWPNLLLLALGIGLLLGLNWLAMRHPRINQYLLAGQLSILLLLAITLIAWSRPEVYGEAAIAPRLHVGAALVVAMVIAIGLAWLIAGSLFSTDIDGDLARTLPRVELFPPNNRYDFVGRGPIAAVLSALVIAPIRYPTQWLLPGALAALFVPDRWLGVVFLTGVLIAWFLLSCGILFERLMEILMTVGRLFFIGPQHVISILVIGIALARLGEIHYITYLFNTGSSGFGDLTLMRYLMFAYVVAWYYAFWCDQFVARRLIVLLDRNSAPVTPVRITYPFVGDPEISMVQADGRSISRHGAGRLRIQGRYDERYNKGAVFQFMTPADVIARFRDHAELAPGTTLAAKDLLASLRNLQRATIVYPAIIGTLAYGLIGGPAVFSFFWAVQPPELSVTPSGGGQKDVAAFLTDSGIANGACEPLKRDEPRIAVIASGGGTRAAIYTASVLRGLAENGKICNVVLASGVSGGSAALAYFALHEGELRKPGPPGLAAWDRFSATMALPFIEYAIDRSSDQRIAFGRRDWRTWTCGENPSPTQRVTGFMPARSRLGQVLAESFVCIMGAGSMGDASFGLMLNTSILGSFPDPRHPCKDADGYSLPEKATRCRNLLDASGAGGRLVLTNLLAPAQPPDNGSRRMELVTLNSSDISIARAAALSANFPPVFPDAAIDFYPSAGEPKRYWVTDGGTVENRGTLTLYYSARDGLSELKRGADKLPPFHIVIADASAAAGAYSESFGFGSLLSAGGQVSLGLETEIRADLERIYCRFGSTLRFHEITMPPALTNGGIGTHWLLPATLTFTKPDGSGEQATLSAHDVNRLVVALHSRSNIDYEDDDDAKKVLNWTADGPASNHDANWRELIKQLLSPDEYVLEPCDS